MQALLQRVRHASVAVDQHLVGEIQQGLLVFLGVEPEDTPAKAEALIERILKYRVFSDAQDKMNLSLQDVQGGLLLVSQFTLAADTRKGLRPSFSSAAPPALGLRLYEHALAYAHQQHPQVAGGRFGADMQVSLVNDGPVTFLLSN